MANRIAGIVGISGVLLLVQRGSAQSVLAPHIVSNSPNSLALAAARIGPKQCLPDLNAIAALGVQGTTGNDLLIDSDGQRVGMSSMFSLVGLESTKGSAAMTVTAVPEMDGWCSISAERISFVPNGCEMVERQELAGYRMTPLLHHMAVYSEVKDSGSSVSLIDSPLGCLVI